MHIYAIGDIHGHLDLLERAHELIAADSARHGAAQVVHVGDLVDRGANSRGVIDWLMAGAARGEDWVVLKGNHDRMFSLFMCAEPAHDPGLRADLGYLHPRIGGASTLASYGVRAAADRPVAAVHADARAAVPAAHLDWLAMRPALHRLDTRVFVHAGIRPGIAFDEQTETDLIWIREPFLMDPSSHGALIVHGHTALEAARHYGNRLNIDSGAAYGGPLSAVAIEEDGTAFLLTHTGRVPLPPTP